MANPKVRAAPGKGVGYGGGPNETKATNANIQASTRAARRARTIKALDAVASAAAALQNCDTSTSSTLKSLKRFLVAGHEREIEATQGGAPAVSPTELGRS